MEAYWLTLPNNSHVNFQYGELDSSELPGRATTQNATFRVYFARPYKAKPKIKCWFTSISQPAGRRSLKCLATNVTQNACTINIETWDGGQFERAKVMWLAWDTEYDGKSVRSGATHFKKEDGPSEAPWYDGSFARQPVAFAAINYIDFPAKGPSIRCYASIHEVTKDKMKWQAGTWNETTMGADGKG